MGADYNLSGGFGCIGGIGLYWNGAIVGVHELFRSLGNSIIWYAECIS